MEYNNVSQEKVNAFEQDIVGRRKEIEEAYRYDNSIRSEWVNDVRDILVSSNASLLLWGSITDVALQILHGYCDKSGEVADYERLRMFKVDDKVLLKEQSAAVVELFYRTADIPHRNKNVPFSPWPDVYIGELFLLMENDIPVGAMPALQDKLGNGANIRRERVTDHTKFPKTLLEAKEVSRDHLWFPGTNVAIEDMTDQLWSDLAQTLPDDMAF